MEQRGNGILTLCTDKDRDVISRSDTNLASPVLSPCLCNRWNVIVGFPEFLLLSITTPVGLCKPPSSGTEEEKQKNNL